MCEIWEVMFRPAAVTSWIYGYLVVQSDNLHGFSRFLLILPAIAIAVSRNQDVARRKQDIVRQDLIIRWSKAFKIARISHALLSSNVRILEVLPLLVVHQFEI